MDLMRTEQAARPRATRASPIAPRPARPRRGWVWVILAGAAAVGVANALVFALTA